MKRWGLSTLILSVFLLLSACGYFSFGKKYNVNPIYNPEVAVVKKWMIKPSHGATKNYLKLTPIINDGRLFTTDVKGKVTSVNVTNGSEYWQVNLKEPIVSGPGAGDGMVFVGTENAKIFALKEENGAVVWRKDVSNQVLANPTYGYGLVILKTIQGELIALDSKTGQEQWTYSEDLPRLILRGGSSARIENPLVVTGFSNAKLAVVTLNKGKLVWEKEIAQPSGYSDLSRMVDIDAEPVIDDGVIYVSTYQGNVIALELNSGKVRWQQKLSSHSGLAVSASAVIVSDSLGRVWSFDKETGQVNWRQNELDGQVLTGPVLLGPYIVVADSDGFVHWLAEKDGHFISRQFFNKSGVISPPLSSDNMVIVSAKDGTLVALQPKSNNL